MIERLEQLRGLSDDSLMMNMRHQIERATELNQLSDAAHKLRGAFRRDASESESERAEGGC